MIFISNLGLWFSSNRPLTEFGRVYIGVQLNTECYSAAWTPMFVKYLEEHL